MRICLVSLDFKPYRSSGLTIYAEDLAKGLKELGHSVTVIAAQRNGLPNHDWVDGVEVLRTPLGSLNWITYCYGASRLLSQMRQNNPWDVIHFLDVHFAYAYRGRFIASAWQSFRQRLTANAGQPYHTSKLDWLRRQAYYRLAKACMEQPSVRKAGQLLASCQSTLNEFVSNYHVPPHHIDLVYQGIDLNCFQRVPTELLRTQLGLKNNRLLLTAGFMTPRKGMEYLGRALQQLPPDVHLLVMGSWESGYRKVFEKSLGKAALRVHQLGFVSDEERTAYYSLADVYVAPSILEGLGITPIEAMACETPAIVTSATSGPEEVGKAGLVVNPRDAEALACAIRTLLGDESLRIKLGKLGRERVVRKFSHTKMAHMTQQVYQKVLGKVN